MKKYSLGDYAAYILFKVAGMLLRYLPAGMSFFIGRRLGDLLYFFDLKHRSLVYANLKFALGKESCPASLKHITRHFYRTFGENFIEIFLLPLVDKAYLEKYIAFEGLEQIEESFKKGKGVILASVHAGGWEIANIVTANLGFNFYLFVRDQVKYPLLEELLNSYRSQRGCKLIQRKNRTRELIQILKNNEAIGITIDQGGRLGVPVKFFGKNASMSSGAVRLALKYQAVILPVFFIRRKGPYIKIIIDKPFEVRHSADAKKDLRDNLQELVCIFEGYIRRYPKEYLWTYKVWKYSDERNIVILSDARAGHLRQAQAVAKIAGGFLNSQGLKTNVETITVRFKNNFARFLCMCSIFFSGRYSCQGCLWCLRKFLEGVTYNALKEARPDLIISCGSSLAGINFLLSRQNLARSAVILRPSFLGSRRFNLVIMPRHDRPAKAKNIVTVEGALNLIDSAYLKEETEKLIRKRIIEKGNLRPAIGLLIGGDSRAFHLDRGTVLEVIKQVKLIAQKKEKDILITTSRRTPREIELLLRSEFQNYPLCKLLIIANEDNIPEAVGGILGLSEMVVVSPESISMISEAVNSEKYVLVFDSHNLGRKHRGFLDNYAKNNYIYLVEAKELAGNIEDLLSARPAVHAPRDNLKVIEGLKKVL